MQGGSGSGDPESKANLQSLLAQLRLQSGTDSPTPAGRNVSGTGPAGPDLLSHFNSYQNTNPSYNPDSPNVASSYDDSPAFLPAAPTPPSFVQPQYLPGPMHPIGTGRDAPVNDGRTANLLSLLKNTGPSSQLGSQQASQEHPISIPHIPIPPSVIHAPAPVAADPSGLLAALMRGSLQTDSKPENEAEQPEPAAPTSVWNVGPPSNDTKQYLLNLLNRPKPSQENSPREQAQPNPHSAEHHEPSSHVAHQASGRPAELPAIPNIPSRTEFDFQPKASESLTQKFGSPHSQHSHHSHAGSAPKATANFSYSNPFDDFPGSSPGHRTPNSTTPGASGSATVSSQTAVPIQILRKQDSAQSNGDRKYSGSERGSIDTPEHARRKLEHVASPLSQNNANEERLALEPVDREKESVSEAISGIAETANRQATEAIARAEEEQAQLEIARTLEDMVNATTEEDFEASARAAAIGIQDELAKDENMGLLEDMLPPDAARAVHEIIDEAAHQGPVADSWESAEADEIIVIEEAPTPVKVYNLPMKPWIIISIHDNGEHRASFRPESILDIARLKKDFDQNDRNLVSPSESYISYGMSKAGGLRIIRQEDGKDAKLFTDTKDRIFNLSISSAPSGEHPSEAIIGTGVSGTVYWVQLRDGDRDHLDDAHPEQYGFALPPLSTHEGDAPGGVLKTRARASSMHPEYFAVGRGKSINIIWPSFIFEHRLFKAGHDRVVDTETLLKKSSLKINTGKAGKDFTFSQDDSVVVSLDKSGRVKFWDVRELTAGPNQPSTELKEALLTFTTTPDGEKAWPTSVLLLDKFRPYQKRTALRYMIVGMKQNHTLQLWDLALGKAVQEINFPHNKESDAVCSVMYHAPSSMIVVGHPTRNSIYFLHLSAPKYTLKNMSQVDYTQRLAALDAIPQPESTAVISGIREYSFATKGTLRSLSILENPAMTPEVEPEEPTLFELYAVHSKGVTCISVKQAELGWTTDNKVISGVDAVESGFVKITKIPSQPSAYALAASAASASTSVDSRLNVGEVSTPPIRIATRNAKDSSLQKSSSSQGEDNKKSQESVTPTKIERREEEAVAHQTEKPEKKSRKKKGSAAAAASTTTASGQAGPTAEREMAPSGQNGAQDSKQTKSLLTPKSEVPQDSNLEALIANMESRIVGNTSARFDTVLQGIVAQLTQLQNQRDSDFMESQAGLLNMVAEVLSKNTESVLKGIIVQQFQAATPDLTKAVDRSVSDHIASKVNQAVQKSLPSSLAQGLQKPDMVKAISEKVSHTLSPQIETHVTKAVNNALAVFTNKAAQSVQQVGNEFSLQVNETNRRIDSHRREQDSKIDKLIAQTSELTGLVSSLAASQAQLQIDVLAIKQQLLQDRSSERSHASPHASRGQAPSQGSLSSHHNVPASRDVVAFPHPQENQPQYAPASHEDRDKFNLEELVKTVDNQMQASKFDDAMIRWLQSDDHTEEIYTRVISKYNPSFVAQLQPLLLLSVGATVSKNLDSPQVAQKMAMIEMVIYHFHAQIPNLVSTIISPVPSLIYLPSPISVSITCVRHTLTDEIG